MADPVLPSTKPYLLRAIYEWCTDHGFTPYVAVEVDPFTSVPMEHVHDGHIVLNISPDATGRLFFNNEALQFTARFGGVPRELYVPVGRIGAIYAKESGAGMSFVIEETPDQPIEPTSSGGSASKKSAGRAKLQRVK